MSKIRIGIIGGAGYTGGELLRLLLNHPQADIVYIHSKSNAGNPVHQVHTDLVGETDLRFADRHDAPVDVVFLCMGHGESRKFLDANPQFLDTSIIDLSQDYRLAASAQGFVYGLPEQHREAIQSAKHIANPGCFATAMQLALLPLASQGLLTGQVHISGVTGSTGAGQALSATSHFSWRSNNLSHYKLFTHQHLNEVHQLLHSYPTNGQGQQVFFVPYRGNFTRGILVTAYAPTLLDEPALVQLYEDYYRSHPFTHLSTDNIDLKQVVNTNKALLYVQKLEGMAVITSAIDNLLKGASGQAVQNMNLMFDLPEDTGLRLKPVAF